MVRFVRSSQARELIGMRFPVEVTAIDDNTTYGSSMTVHVLGSRVSHDIGTPFERTAVDWCSKGIVYNQRYTVLVSDAGKLLDIEYINARVRDGFTEEGLGVRLECLLKFFFRSIDVNECTFDAQLLHGYGEEIECTAIDSRCTYEMVACLTDVEDGIEVGCLAR